MPPVAGSYSAACSIAGVRCGGDPCVESADFSPFEGPQAQGGWASRWVQVWFIATAGGLRTEVRTIWKSVVDNALVKLPSNSDVDVIISRLQLNL